MCDVYVHVGVFHVNFLSVSLDATIYCICTYVRKRHTYVVCTQNTQILYVHINTHTHTLINHHAHNYMYKDSRPTDTQRRIRTTHNTCVYALVHTTGLTLKCS